MPVICRLCWRSFVCILFDYGIFVTFLIPIGHFDLNLLITIAVFFAVFIDLLVDLIKDKVWGRNVSCGLLK